MDQTTDSSPLMISAILVFGLFFMFRWVFKERYSEEVSRNYALVAAFICGVITYGALMN